MSLPTASAPLINLVLGSRNRKKCGEMADLIAPPWERRPWMERVAIGSLDAYPGADHHNGDLQRDKEAEQHRYRGCQGVAPPCRRITFPRPQQHDQHQRRNRRQ